MWTQIGKGFMDGFQFIINCGPTVMLPIIITIVGLIFGLKITSAFKAGLTLGIGFAGIKLVLDFMTTQLMTASFSKMAMAKHNNMINSLPMRRT